MSVVISFITRLWNVGGDIREMFFCGT